MTGACSIHFPIIFVIIFLIIILAIAHFGMRAALHLVS